MTGPAHPARWSKPILGELERLLFDEAAARPEAKRAVDPFAGVGLSELARVAPQWSWSGLEIEAEWAQQSPGCIVGDATRPPFAPASIDVLVTSCTYGNRMADSYMGERDTCTSCAGAGCPDCDATGFRPSKRRTYAIALGRPLSPGNSGGMHWRSGAGGKAYRQLHRQAWTEAWRYLLPGALIALNVSNSIATVGPKAQRVRVESHVVEWHLTCWLRLGASLVATVPVSTQRFGFGANGQSRSSNEWILLLRKPVLGGG